MLKCLWDTNYTALQNLCFVLTGAYSRCLRWQNTHEDNSLRFCSNYLIGQIRLLRVIDWGRDEALICSPSLQLRVCHLARSEEGCRHVCLWMCGRARLRAHLPDWAACPQTMTSATVLLHPLCLAWGRLYLSTFRYHNCRLCCLSDKGPFYWWYTISWYIPLLTLVYTCGYVKICNIRSLLELIAILLTTQFRA